MKVAFNFVFNRKKEIKKTSDKGLIELRAYYKAKTKYISTKISVLNSEWNDEKERIYSRNPEASQLNDELDRLLEKLRKAQRENEIKGLVFDLDTVKKVLGKQKQTPLSFTQFALTDINDNNLNVGSTKADKKTTLTKFLSYTSNKPVLFQDLSKAFVYGFINYLKGTGLSQNTIRKHNKNLKALIEKAILLEYFDGPNPCKEIKIKETETRINILVWEQIKKIEELSFEAYENKLEIIRDMFLFACFTGLRISDVINLKTEYIKIVSNQITLDFFTKKVNKHAVLSLNKLFPVEDSSRPIKILLKYYNSKNEYLFRKFSEQYINRELKQIGQMAGINFKLHFHISRDTFATYMASKVPSTTLKRLLQHSNLKTTERYVHLNDQLVNENLLKADWD